MLRVSASAKSCFNWRVCDFSLLSDDSNSSFSALSDATRGSFVFTPLDLCMSVKVLSALLEHVHGLYLLQHFTAIEEKLVVIQKAEKIIAVTTFKFI